MSSAHVNTPVPDDGQSSPNGSTPSIEASDDYLPSDHTRRNLVPTSRFRAKSYRPRTSLLATPQPMSRSPISEDRRENKVFPPRIWRSLLARLTFRLTLKRDLMSAITVARLLPSFAPLLAPIDI